MFSWLRLFWDAESFGQVLQSAGAQGMLGCCSLPQGLDDAVWGGGLDAVIPIGPYQFGNVLCFCDSLTFWSEPAVQVLL